MTATVVTSENLAEFNAQRMGLSAPAEASTEEPVVEATEDSAEEPNEAETQEEQTEKPEKKANPKVEKRFSELTKQREEARREAERERSAREAAEARLKELEGKATPKEEAKPADKKPVPEQFKDAFEYAEALAEWSAEQALSKRDAEEKERRAAAERQRTVDSFQERQKAVVAELPDYTEKVGNSPVVVSDQVRDAILESDVGPKILYHLADNPDVTEKIRGMSVASALREIGRIEGRLSSQTTSKSEKPVATPSRAAAPINPIRSTKVTDTQMGSDGEFHGTYAAWKEARAAGRIK